MKFSLDALVIRLTHQHITNFSSLSSFDDESIQNLHSVCENSILSIEEDAINTIAAESSVSKASVSSILVSRLVTAFNADEHYCSISRAMSVQNMGHASVLENFKIEHEAYLSVKDDDDLNVSKMNDRDNDRKIIRCAPIFNDFLSNSCGSRGPMKCVLREHHTVPDKVVHLLLSNCEHGESGSLISES